ncbi:uncharacterized protein BDZ99DRAFT_566811 [Mytilinidion resinicola]|uniref:Protein SQS1 n=1 Tax=Mytilinidion resinicola TaxID=574789 RepID=A0A6A6Z147_9PEZI|nr:uncharacterized protein BDZ99DRAFT_566811 [Mytilinidion resinicola]KAF2814886.1 hypothetical protein BDZ99DRAFT_566811 [Mytilinidion resinicola]
MSRKKKAAFRPKASGPPTSVPRGPRNRQSSGFRPFAPSSHTPSRFTLADEAQHTARNPKFWNTDQKLRSKQVNFVSAGHLHGEQPKDIGDTRREDEDEEGTVAASSTPDVAMASMTLQSDSSSSPDTPRSPPGLHTPADDTPAPMADPAPADFFVDMTGAQAVPTGIPPPVVRAASPTPSDSSEEVVLFKGRNNLQSSVTPVSPAEPSTTRRVPQPAKSVPQSQKPLPKLKDANPAPTVAKPASNTADRLSSTKGKESDEEIPSLLLRNHAMDTPSWAKGTTPWEHKSKPGVGWLEGRRKRPKRVFDPDAVDKAALNDYMDNIKRQQQLGEFETPEYSAFAQRPLALADGKGWQPEDSEGVEQPVVREKTSITFVQETATVEPDNEADPDEWDSVMLDDFENNSTSSDVEGPVERILSKRTRKNGLSYLVVYEGRLTDDARWLPANYLTTERDVQLLWDFETKLQAKEGLQRQALESSDSDFDSSDDDDDEDAEDDFQDEKDLIARRLESMTDEQIARRLAKQEELGLGSDEVLLFEDDSAMDDDMEQEENNITKSAFTSVNSSSRSRKRGGRARGDFPSASLMADVLEQDPYGGFDVMDTERPSLKKKSKGRRGQFPVEISDSDLEAQMRSIWEADRRKKAEYKKEREELRAQGLLGKKNKDKANLAIKYSEGFTMAEMLEEIREFFISDHQSRALPPMEAHERAHIHRFAKKLELTTKSVGAGKDRFINLSKNTRTRPYKEIEFNSIMYKFRFLNNHPKTPKGKVARVRNVAKPVFSYRDGDVVGANAPEIGAENKGHALLQKMGWTKGMALGALENKGILQPIAHTVKSGKAGLK